MNGGAVVGSWTREGALRVRLGSADLMEVAPPTGGRRRLADDEHLRKTVGITERRRKQEEREGEKMSRGCRNPPSSSRCRRMGRRWTEATGIGENCHQKRKGNDGRGEDLGHPGSITCIRRWRETRRTLRCPRNIEGWMVAATPW
jgi:hypothetical protein